MRNKIILTISIIGLIASSATTANAASTPKANGACTTAGMSAKISGKTYQCATNLGGKLVWMLPSPTSSAAKPNIGGGSGGNRGPRDEGSAADLARHAAFKKYTDCLSAKGVKQLPFGPGRGRDDNNGVRPTLDAKTQAAMKACSALRPQFGRPGDNRASAPKIPNASPTAKA